MTHSFRRLPPQPASARVIAAALAACLPALPLTAFAQPAPAAAAASRNYDVAAGALADALMSFARQAGITLSFTPEQVRGRYSPGLTGSHEIDTGLAALLAGSGLMARAGTAGYVLEAAPPNSERVGVVLPAVRVQAAEEADPSALPEAFAGGEVARGGRLGLFGNVDVFDMPFSSTSYTSVAIANQQARYVVDVLATDPSIRAASSSTDFEDTLVIRGFPAGAGDISVNGLFGVLPLLSIDAASIERIEVFKGPSAFLNGMSPTGAVGGIVNLVPKRAQDTPLTRITASYDSDSQLGTHVDVGRRFGTHDAFGVRFNGVYRDGDTPIDANSERTRLAALGIDWRGERLSVALDAGIQRRDARGGNGLSLNFFGDSLPAAPDPATQLAPPWAYFDSEDRYGLIASEMTMSSDLTLYASYGINRSRFRSLVTLADLNGETVSYLPLATPQDYDRQGGEAGVRASFTTGAVRHDLSAALSYYDFVQSYVFAFFDPFTTTLDERAFAERPDTSDVPAPAKWTNIRLSGIALGDTLHMLDDRVAFTLGARVQQVRQHYYDGSGVNYEESAVSPAFGLVVKPLPHLSLYGNYIQGLARGDVAPEEALNANEALPPYKSKQAEVGVKLEHGSVGTTLALFQIKKPAAALGPDRYFRLTGEQRNRGIELTVFGEPLSGVRLRGGIAALDAKITRSIDDSADGADAVGVPDLQINLDAEWDVPALPGLTFRAGFAHSGRSYLDTANTLRLDDWHTFDLGARYRLDAGRTPLTLRADVRNASDEAYWFATTSGGTLNLGAPRTVLVSMTADF